MKFMVLFLLLFGFMGYGYGYGGYGGYGYSQNIYGHRQYPAYSSPLDTVVYDIMNIVHRYPVYYFSVPVYYWGYPMFY